MMWCGAVRCGAVRCAVWYLLEAKTNVPIRIVLSYRERYGYMLFLPTPTPTPPPPPLLLLFIPFVRTHKIEIFLGSLWKLLDTCFYYGQMMGNFSFVVFVIRVCNNPISRKQKKKEC